MKSIVVLGGDGFCGWPIALHLSDAGHDVTIIDNLSRRRIDTELNTAPLMPIADMAERCRVWKKVTGRKIRFENVDIALNYNGFRRVLADQKPDVIVHLAEQRSAPYSTLSPAARQYTVTNNIGTTHAALNAITDLGLDCHLVHLGTIGIFGYCTAGHTLPEGYVTATLQGADDRTTTKEILYPGEPVSLYHMTKALDQQLFAHYARTEGVQITDLNQGIVWGHATPETMRDPRLRTRLDTDAIYGTVVNRFLVQAATGQPLSIYGTGGQTRSFIHLQDAAHCVALAIATPPATSDRFRIVNQITETRSIADLATHVAQLTGAQVEFCENPRQEPAENEFEVASLALKELGLQPTLFDTQLPIDAADVAAAVQANAA